MQIISSYFKLLLLNRQCFIIVRASLKGYQDRSSNLPTYLCIMFWTLEGRGVGKTARMLILLYISRKIVLTWNPLNLKQHLHDVKYWIKKKILLSECWIIQHLHQRNVKRPRNWPDVGLFIGLVIFTLLSTPTLVRVATHPIS